MYARRKGKYHFNVQETRYKTFHTITFYHILSVLFGMGKEGATSTSRSLTIHGDYIKRLTNYQIHPVALMCCNGCLTEPEKLNT